jgi:hypothetical protein
MTAQTAEAICPKCHTQMLYVTAMPHPKAPGMRRTTFACYTCNTTRSYILSPEMAGAYAAASVSSPKMPPNNHKLI